jgi:hypothetical protein
MQIYVLGGSPCSGKSSIADRLAADFGLNYYKIDDYEQAHCQRCNAEQQPILFQYLQYTWNERWMRELNLQVEEEFTIARERWPMVLDDIQTLKQPLLVEGASALPELVWSWIGPSSQVAYLVPEANFQFTHYRQRPWIKHILKECADPEEAFDRWMQRDQLFGHKVLSQAQALGYHSQLIDGSCSLEEHYQAVVAWFGLG